jgi:hypothetical protein
MFTRLRSSAAPTPSARPSAQRHLQGIEDQPGPPVGGGGPAGRSPASKSPRRCRHDPGSGRHEREADRLSAAPRCPTGAPLAVQANSGLPSGLRMIYNIKMEVRTSSSSLVPGPGAPRRCSRPALSFTATLPPGHQAHHARAGNTVAETVLRAVLARAWRARPNCYPINTPSPKFFVHRLTTVALSNIRVVASRTIVQPRCVRRPMGHPVRTHPMGQPRRTQNGQ